MNRKQRTIFLLVVFWSVVIGVPGVWLWQADRQEELNRQLITAIKREDTPAALVALEQGADGNARDEPRVPGWKKLWDLARGRRAGSSKAPTALLLLLAGAGELPYEDAKFRSAKESPQLVSTLLAHGAQVNVNDWLGFTLLFYAFAQGQKSTIMLLIVHGADVNQGYDVGGFTLLEYAVVANDPDYVRLLLRYHADPYKMSISQHSKHPWAYAEENNMPEIAKLLRDAAARQ